MKKICSSKLADEYATKAESLALHPNRQGVSWTQEFKEAFLAGWQAGVSQFKVTGTDGCKDCETGRVTLFVANRSCTECDPESYEREEYGDKPGAKYL